MNDEWKGTVTKTPAKMLFDWQGNPLSVEGSRIAALLTHYGEWDEGARKTTVIRRKGIVK